MNHFMRYFNYQRDNFLLSLMAEWKNASPIT